MESTYRESRGGFRLVEIKLRVPREVYAADSVEVGFAFFFDTGTLSCSGGAGHIVKYVVVVGCLRSVAEEFSADVQFLDYRPPLYSGPAATSERA